MRYAIFVLGLIIGGWGIRYLSTDAGLHATNMTLDACKQLFSHAADQFEGMKCDGRAWGSYEAGKNRAIWGMVIGGMLALLGLRSILSKAKQATS